MSEHEIHILVAEDLEENRFALNRLLKKSEFKGQYTFANDGQEARDLLEQNSEKYTIALLDRMMPRMNGLEVLQFMKSEKQFRDIPVIFQSAMAQIDDISEGLSAGAYYYITKPYPTRDTFTSIIRLAIDDYLNISSIQKDVQAACTEEQSRDDFTFQFKTLAELRQATIRIACACPDPHKATMGIFELLQNAVEHGNAGITYDEKTHLNETGKWEQEVSDRLALPDNAQKCVSVEVLHEPNQMRIIIKDEGDGFNFAEYLKMSPERAFDNHGRRADDARACIQDPQGGWWLG